MYPKEVSLLEKQLIDKSDITIDEFNRITPIKNRTEFLESKVNIIFTDNDEDNCVVFPMPGYSKKAYVIEENKAYVLGKTKNKL